MRILTALKIQSIINLCTMGFVDDAEKSEDEKEPTTNES